MEQRILRLDNLTANQIAAGEVIERPVSVVKELVENAIDAGSQNIKIEIQEGGLRLIRITDDGAGIDGCDLPLAIERHATSKLRQIRDLDDLTTLGFRGEALASIASVAALQIITRRREEVQGYCLSVKGEAEDPVINKVGSPTGTQVSVEHLFFNTPARLKFMKTPGYEGGLIHDLIIQLALGYPEIDFRLENQGKCLLNTTGIARAEDLVELFYGKEARQALVPASGIVSRGSMAGWVTAPPYSRGTRKSIHIFINGRRISIKDLQWSIERAFEHLLPKGRFPLALLRFSLPGSLLDVNVHPGKLEVRINDKDFPAAITRALRVALAGGQLLPDAGSLGGAAGQHLQVAAGGPGAGGAKQLCISPASSDFPPPSSAPITSTAGSSAGPAKAGQIHFGEPTRDWQSLYAFTTEGEGTLNEWISERNPATDTAGRQMAKVAEGDPAATDNPSTVGHDLAMQGLFAALEDANRRMVPGQWGVNSHNHFMQDLARTCRPEDFVFGPDIFFQVIGQLQATFILAEVPAGLLVIDQHVAHERIIYERLLCQSIGRENAQMLLLPISLHLTGSEEETLIRHILLLNDLGLIVERFGPREYILRSVPAGQAMDQAMFRELLEKLEAEGNRNSLEDARQALLVMASCKAAVKANTLLTREEMAALLLGLQQTKHPMTCPHGRPIMYLLPYSRLIQAFGRSK